MFGLGRKAAIGERAQKVARMLLFIEHSMRTKTYDQFLASFSNPGAKPNVLERYGRKAHFTMQMSATCWYSASISFPHANAADEIGFITLQGGGDDFGVFITATPRDDDSPSVNLHLAFDQKAGRDAKAMVRTLEAMPKWTRAAEMEHALGVEY